MFVGWKFLTSTAHPLQTVPQAFPPEDSRPEKHEDAGSRTGPLSILVLGYVGGDDSGKITENLGQRSQSITLFHMPNGRRFMNALAIPPETPVATGTQDLTIGELLSSSDEATVADLVGSVESLLDTRVDHVMLLDYRGVVDMAEELDGVTLYDPEQTAEAQRHLSPEQFEALVEDSRQPYGGSAGDAGLYQIPVESQQEMILSVLNELRIADYDTDLGAMKKLGAVLQPSMAADEEFNTANLLRLGRSMRSIPPSNIVWCAMKTDQDSIEEYRQRFDENSATICEVG